MTRIASLSPGARSFWDAFAAQELAAGRPAPQLYDTMVIGGDEASATIGAELIRSGRKTATSALPSEFDASGQRPPRPGDLSLVLDGRGEPVCVVRTVSVELRRLGDVSDAFAWDYGEWDGTLATWRNRMLAFYSDHLSDDPLATPLLCERFVRAWPRTD